MPGVGTKILGARSVNPSCTKGEIGGLSRQPMISETVDSTTFNFGRPLGQSMRGKKLVECMI